MIFVAMIRVPLIGLRFSRTEFLHLWISLWKC